MYHGVHLLDYKLIVHSGLEPVKVSAELCLAQSNKRQSGLRDVFREDSLWNSMQRRSKLADCGHLHHGHILRYWLYRKPEGKYKCVWSILTCTSALKLKFSEMWCRAITQTDVSEEWAATILMAQILYPEDLNSKFPETSLWLPS